MPEGKTVRIAVLVSGGGSNLEAILKAQESGMLPGGQVVLVVSSRPGVLALERAQKRGIATAVVDPKTFADDARFQAALEAALEKAQIKIICLAGYLRKLGVNIIRRYRSRILNIHPALLPKYGGAGMWGHYVHEAVLAAGDKESGCSVHVVDEEFDHGPVLAQTRVPVLPGDTAETLAARILEQEHKLYPETLRNFIKRL